MDLFASSAPLLILVAAILLAPFAVKWWVTQRRGGSMPPAGQHIIETTALGPQQRVVTIEAGPAHARVWLVLGVSAGQITTLHVAPLVPQEVAQTPVDTSPDLAMSASPVTDHFARKLALFRGGNR